MWGGGDKPLQTKPSRVSRELKSAIADDLYKEQVNDAKIKAMGDLVDYDTFKARVSVAHLRPLGAPNIHSQVSCSPASLFNSDGTRVAPSASQGPVVPPCAAAAPHPPAQVPTSSPAFERAWRRSCPTPQDKFHYMLLIPPENLPQIFKVEITPTLLGDVLVVLNDHCLTSESPAQEDLDKAALVLRLLGSFTGVGRFSLTSKLLNPKAKSALVSLSNKLKGTVDPTIPAQKEVWTKWGLI